MSKPLRILFVCTGNSCRSQMAEGWARHLGGDRVESFSAGTHPAGYVNPMAIEAMGEAGIDISGQTSKALDAALLKRMDVVVTVCGQAEVNCPVVPTTAKRIHWPIPDPVGTAGDRETIRRQFLSVRDDIRRRMEELLRACDGAAVTGVPRPKTAARARTR
ncbi:MAG: arsenate reductase ArsC [Deltaproteobacteria bacterium]|nr:arsenate reductase ArsC [Deltaproteobacteria bacterium]